MNKRRVLYISCLMAIAVASLVICQPLIFKTMLEAFTSTALAQTQDEERKAKVSSPNGLKPVPPDLQIPARDQQITSTATLLEGKRPPEHVIYNQMFRHLKELNEQADEEEKKGKDGKHLRQLYKRLAKLDDGQAIILDQVAAENNRDVERLNAEAKKIIKTFREKHKGKLKGDTLPAPPPELMVLAQERKQTILRARDRLRYSIGEEAFDKFKEFINERVTPSIYQLDIKGQLQVQPPKQAQVQAEQGGQIRSRTRKSGRGSRNGKENQEGLQPNLAPAPGDCDFGTCDDCSVSYVYTSTWAYQSGNFVYGYAITELDYCAAPYFDPTVRGRMFEGGVSQDKLVAEAYDEGYADWEAARVYVEYVYPKPDEIYETYSNHGIVKVYNGERKALFITRDTVRFTAPNQCQPGQNFSPSGRPCPTPSPSPSPSPDPTPTPDTRFQVFLQSQNFVRPAGTTVVEGQTTSVVRVLTQPAQPGKTVNLRLEGYADTGGHIDALHKRNLDGTSARPLGRLRNMRGTTNNGGTFETTYTPSHIAGKIRITATIDNIDVANDMFISVPNLIELQDGVNYVLVGFDTTPEHPQGTNHFGTFDANVNLIHIADAYRDAYYPAPNQIPEDKKVLLNDQSLPFGGKFDLKPKGSTAPNWAATGSHAEHREGINCDFASKNITTDRWDTMKEIFRNNGTPNYHDETDTTAPHWHLRLDGSTQQAALTRNAGNFVDENFWSPLDRAANDAEWEYWISRIESAQTQGFDATLAEAKTFERALFQSTEYINRNRNDEDYISDLYWGYLQREPDAGEYNARLQALRNANANGQNGREQVLRMFEDDAEFIGIVSSIEGTTTTPVGCDPIQEQDCYNNGGSWDFSTCSCNYNPDPCWSNGYYLCE